MKTNLTEYYAIGQIVNYNNQAKNGTIIKLTKTSVTVRYNSYRMRLHSVKMPAFLECLKVIQPASTL